MPIAHKGLLCGSLIAGALLAVSAHAQTPPPAEDPAAVSGVTVKSKPPPRRSDRVLKLPSRSAASCAFDPRTDTYEDDYIVATTGFAPNRPEWVGEGDPQSGDIFRERYFSATSPLGDASSISATSMATAAGAGSAFFVREGVYGASGPAEYSNVRGLVGCIDADRLTAAGRSEIARRDRTLPEGFALYEAGRYEDALALFRKAYNKLPDGQGGIEAALMIGKIKLLGQAGEPDVPEALTWLRRAAGSAVGVGAAPPFDPADPYAQLTPQAEAALLLARAHLYGYGVPKDPRAARKWFARADALGYVPAAKSLGDLYYHGHDGRPDPGRAAAYYKKAAGYGFAPAQYALAEISYRGAAGVAADPSAALAWYAQAARAGHPDALYALALAYDSGDGVPADPQKALGFYKEAALAGHAGAQTALGGYFYEGRLLARDHATARRWFETAAAAGDPDAMFNLAVMQMKGEGGDTDRVKAWVWFKLADRLKKQNAATALRSLEGRMSPAERRAAAEILEPKRAG